MLPRLSTSCSGADVLSLATRRICDCPTPLTLAQSFNSAGSESLGGQISGCHMAMRRAVIERIGYLDERSGGRAQKCRQAQIMAFLFACASITTGEALRGTTRVAWPYRRRVKSEGDY